MSCRCRSMWCYRNGVYGACVLVSNRNAKALSKGKTMMIDLVLLLYWVKRKKSGVRTQQTD